MEEIDLIKSLERISSKFPNRILKIKGFTLKKNINEELEIIIYKGFSSSTTHQIEIDLEKNVVESDIVLSNFKLYEAPLTQTSNNFISASQEYIFFLNEKNWI